MADSEPGQGVGSSRLRPGTEHLAPEVRDAIAETFLHDLPDELLAAVLEGAEEHRLQAGATVYDGRSHEATSIVAVVVDGLLRACVRSPTGRQATIGYSGFGSLVGLVSAILGAGTTPGQSVDHRWTDFGSHLLYGDTVRESRILRLDHVRFVTLAKADVALAWHTAKYVTALVVEGQQMLAANVFFNARARVARHLLDLAERDGHELVVSATQREIAAAVGSVREVVSRTLARLNDDGILERRAGRIILRDVALLHEAARGY